MNIGYIKLHRQFKNTSFYKDTVVRGVFLHLLLSANFKDNEVFVNGKVVVVKKGQLLTGFDVLSLESGYSRSQVRRAIKSLILTRTITRRATNKYSIISILNWDTYQQETTPKTTPTATNKRQAGDRLATANKKVKKVKKINIYASLNCLTDELCLEISEQYNVSEKSVRVLRDKLKGWCEAKGKKYKNYKAALQNWVRTAIEKGEIKKIVKPTFTETAKVSEVERIKVSEMMSEFRQKGFKA